MSGKADNVESDGTLTDDDSSSFGSAYSDYESDDDEQAEDKSNIRDHKTRISFRNNSVLPIASTLSKMLAFSPDILHDPNEMQVHNTTITTVCPVFGDRQSYSEFYSPLLISEGVSDMSSNFLFTDQVTRVISLKKFPRYFAAGLDLFEGIFQTSKSAFEEFYQKKFSNSVWLFHKMPSDNGPDANKLKYDKQVIKHSTIFVFLKSFKMANFDEQQNDDLPFWPTSEKTVFHPSNDMIVAKATFYVEKAKFARLVPVDKEPPNRFAITFAANIITLIKGLRMFAIKEPTPDDSDDEDHNVSPLYDCIINPTEFQTNIYTADQSLDDKVIALVNCPNTAVLIEDGGPGTGKTTLATKAIAHAMQEQEKEKEGASMRVLMCASSNSAADILFNKMTAIFPSKYIYRVGENTRISDVVKSRMDDEKSEILKKLKKREEKNRDRFQEKYGEEASEILAKKYFLQKAQIIVSTLGSAQTTELVNNRAKLNFTLLFIDEAGQSKVDEILLPLHFNSLSKLFIIGDPRQLGPIYKSHLLQQYSPSITSTFTRLCFLLADKPGVVHRLRLQFRMHDSVARIVNSISYRNDDQLTTSLDGNWCKVANHLPFAVFTSRDWTDEVSGGSFSRHSEKEAEFGMQLLKASLILAGFNFGTNCFKPGYEPLQYAIIPLYKSQVKLYRNLVKRENLQHVVNVATVDQMQGSEVNIAIVSAVRASEDINGSVGFASDIRRLNVALSRAGAVYVLAKAHTFRSTPGWTKIFIAAVKENLLFQFDGDFDGRRLDQFLSRNMQENMFTLRPVVRHYPATPHFY